MHGHYRNIFLQLLHAALTSTVWFPAAAARSCRFGFTQTWRTNFGPLKPNSTSWLQRHFEPGTGNWTHLFLWAGWAGLGITFSAHFYNPDGTRFLNDWQLPQFAWCHQFYKVRNAKLLTDRLRCAAASGMHTRKTGWVLGPAPHTHFPKCLHITVSYLKKITWDWN